ncbi:MAG: transglutaminase domain-containing protein [archaeon]
MGLRRTLLPVVIVAALMAAGCGRDTYEESPKDPNPAVQPTDRVPSETDTFDLSQIVYAPTDDELLGFSTSTTLYGGPGFVVADTVGDTTIYRVNYGANVAKHGEPSLTRLVNRLSEDLNTKDQVAQRLLDYVTTHIKYVEHQGDKTDAAEVLINKEGDCTDMTILYASLLEQADIGYLILNLEGHALIAVEGDFDNQNGLGFSWEGTNYFLAETTSGGFSIGQTKLIDPIDLDDIQAFQKPGPNSEVYGRFPLRVLKFGYPSEEFVENQKAYK